MTCGVGACLTFERRGIVRDVSAADETPVVVNGCRLSWWLGVDRPAKTAHKALRSFLLYLSEAVVHFVWKKR